MVGEESMPQRDKYVQAKVMVHNLAGTAESINSFLKDEGILHQESQKLCHFSCWETYESYNASTFFESACNYKMSKVCLRRIKILETNLDFADFFHHQWIIMKHSGLTMPEKRMVGEISGSKKREMIKQ